MGLSYHPKQGVIVSVDFDRGFVPPEMVKTRLAVVLSKPIQRRKGLITVVPLSLSAPDPPMPYHCQIDIPFELPKSWGQEGRWVKGDMICAVSWARTNLLLLGKDRDGKRRYQTEVLPTDQLSRVQRCVLNGLGLSSLKI